MILGRDNIDLSGVGAEKPRERTCNQSTKTTSSGCKDEPPEACPNDEVTTPIGLRPTPLFFLLFKGSLRKPNDSLLGNQTNFKRGILTSLFLFLKTKKGALVAVTYFRRKNLLSSALEYFTPYQSIARYGACFCAAPRTKQKIVPNYRGLPTFAGKTHYHRP